MKLQGIATRTNAPFTRVLAGIVLSSAIALSLSACTVANSNAVNSNGSTSGETIAVDEGLSPVNATANVQDRATMTDDLTLAYWYLQDALNIDIDSLEYLRCYPSGAYNMSTLVQYRAPGQDFQYLYMGALAWGYGNTIGHSNDSAETGISGAFSVEPLEGYDHVYKGVIGADKSWAMNRDTYLVCEADGLIQRVITSNGDGSYTVGDYSYDDENKLTQATTVPSYYGLNDALNCTPIALGKTYDSMVNFYYGSDGSLESMLTLNDFVNDENGLPEMEYRFTRASDGNIRAIERYSYSWVGSVWQREPHLSYRLEYTHGDNGLITEIDGYKYANEAVSEATSFTFRYDAENANDGYVRIYLSPIAI